MIDVKKLLSKVLSQFVVKTWTPSITASTGSLVLAEGTTVCGIHMLRISVRKTSVTANGGNVFVGTLNNCVPNQQTTGVGYYAGVALGGNITASGEITIRNMGTANVPANNNVVMCFTYVGG